MPYGYIVGQHDRPVSCASCEHYERARQYRRDDLHASSRCLHPKLVSFVTGEAADSGGWSPTCCEMRAGDGLCGPTADLFERATGKVRYATC